MQTQNRRHVRAMAVDDGIFMCNYAHRWPLLANTADGRKKKKLVMLFDEVTSLLHWHYHSALSTSDWVLKTIAGGCINDEIMLKRVLVWYRQCGFRTTPYWYEVLVLAFTWIIWIAFSRNRMRLCTIESIGCEGIARSIWIESSITRSIWNILKYLCCVFVRLTSACV